MEAMFVLTVEFEVRPGDVSRFREAILAQARNSLEREPGCRQFDVCFDPQNPAAVFLYEVYDDEKAFQLHLQTKHLDDFSKKVAPWVKQKTVRRWQRHD